MSARPVFHLTASAVFSIALIPQAVHADETVIDAGTVVVTANRTATDKNKVGSKVEVVTRKEIEEKALPTATDYLALLPGVSVSAPGGLGQEGSLAVRGAARRYVKTLYNGIDISDPTSTQVQTSYQYLLSDQLAGIELLKGSQSTLYGSDAIAGVIALDTLGTIENGVRHTIGIEGGSFGTVRGRYGFAAANETSKAAINILGIHTDGISAADAINGNTEADAYDNVTADASFEHQFSENFSVFGSGLFIKGRAEYDNDFTTPPSDALFNVNYTRQIAGRTGFNLDLADGRFRNTVSVQAFDINRAIRTPAFNADYLGRRYKADYQGAVDVADWLTAQFGADYESQNARVTDNFGTNTNNTHSIAGIWGQAIVSPVEDFTVTAGIRQDWHSVFGTVTSYRATGSYLVGDTGMRLHSSVGTGFRAPSLYELFGPWVANPALMPERSLSFDAGVEQTLFDGRVVGDLTFFVLDTDNLIYYDNAVTFTYQQLAGTTRRRGVEASLAVEVTENLSIGGAYTYTHSVRSDGTRNPRVPMHEVALSTVWTPAEKWTVTGTARIVMDTVDTDLLPLSDYVLVNARVAYKPTKDTEFYIRGENLLNQQYQTARGYGTPGISAFAGFKATFGAD